MDSCHKHETKGRPTTKRAILCLLCTGPHLPSKPPLLARSGIQLYHKQVHILAVLGSFALILIFLWDAFEVIILPRRVRRKSRLTRFFHGAPWSPWSAVAQR